MLQFTISYFGTVLRHYAMVKALCHGRTIIKLFHVAFSDDLRHTHFVRFMGPDVWIYLILLLKSTQCYTICWALFLINSTGKVNLSLSWIRHLPFTSGLQLIFCTTVPLILYNFVPLLATRYHLLTSLINTPKVPFTLMEM